MSVEWMGRYRELVRSLIYYSNASNRGGHKLPSINGVSLTKHEYQILEYLCEFKASNRIMADISRDLGILQSIVTKATKVLISYGLVDRYRIVGNRKNIVLKPTPAGEELYFAYYTRYIRDIFEPFFEVLGKADSEDLVMFQRAIDTLGNHWRSFADEVIANELLEKISE
ncbi:MAG: winged helix-turn-helix transcriptional regulator [Oscillospiraceae bacterium]|nr:winged helix-turn-helix transcriptional regulator [Oscillospiraceae bacterium]